MTIDRMIRKTRKAIDTEMHRHGFFPENIIQNPTGWIIEYVGQFGEAYMVVYNTKWRVTNVM